MNVTNDDWIQVSTGSVQFQVMSTNHTVRWRQQAMKPEQSDTLGFIVRGGLVGKAYGKNPLWLRLVGGGEEVVTVETTSMPEVGG